MRAQRLESICELGYKAKPFFVWRLLKFLDGIVGTGREKVADKGHRTE